jgi:acyl-CoA reductase-like NAD-dependent aldehyde dehydrogenase
VVDDLNPSTGKIYARVQQAGAEEVESAIASAYRARESWGGSLVAEREGSLFRAADILATRMQEIRDVLIDESGSTFGKSMFEVAYVIDLLRSSAGEVRHVFGETMPMSQPGQLSMTVRRPAMSPGAGECVLSRGGSFQTPPACWNGRIHAIVFPPTIDIVRGT